MTQGYPPYDNRREDYPNQPPPYQNQNQSQWQPQGYPPQGQQNYQGPPPPSSYYPAEKQEYYPPSPQPPYGSSAHSQPPYPPHNSSGYPPQPPWGPPSPQQHYGGPPPPQSQSPYNPYQAPSQDPYHSPQAPYNQPATAYPPQPNYGSRPPQVPYSSYPGATAPPAQTEEERGILGALGGAAAGGFAGHKMGHGIIGTLGGAFAGHKLEDAYKAHNKPTPSPSHSPQPPPMYSGPPQPQYAPQGGAARVSAGGLALNGNFSATSTSITLDHDFDLIASVTQPYGGTKLSSVALNQYITNNNGNFQWVSGGGNFAASARNVRLTENGTVLEAELADVNGRWNGAKTWLNEKIGNVNGELKYVG